VPYLAIFQQTPLWIPLVRSSILSQVFETEFFPEWLRTSHAWLIQPTADYDEVRWWYQEWRDMLQRICWIRVGTRILVWGGVLREGLLVYVLDDAVWASVGKGVIRSEEDESRAISLDDMVNRVTEGSRM